MIKKYAIYFFIISISLLIYACSNDSDDEYTPISPVTVDLTQVPYPNLSEYHFFEGEMKNQIPSLNVTPYEPISSLFSDYAHKKRFVWMPEGTKATYNGDGKLLELPVGAVLIKNFYYENVLPSNTTRIIETRLMIRKSTGWIFAEYVWNDEQTEAFYDLSGSFTSVTWTQENGTPKTVSNYRIPSETECFVCHKINNDQAPLWQPTSDCRPALRVWENLQAGATDKAGGPAYSCSVSRPAPVSRWFLA